MIATFLDHIYPIQPITHTRATARAILLDEENNLMFLHIKCHDIFGERDHYETVGGGIEEGESAQEAILREVQEESGYANAKILMDLGIISDCYHLLQRQTDSHFFVVQVVRGNVGACNPTEEELAFFDGIIWLKEDEVEETLDLAKQKGKIGELVHRRDLCAFRQWQASR